MDAEVLEINLIWPDSECSIKILYKRLFFSCAYFCLNNFGEKNKKNSREEDNATHSGGLWFRRYMSCMSVLSLLCIVD